MALDPQIALGVQIPTPQNPIQTLTQIENVKALAEQRQALAQERMQQAQALVQKAKDTAAINTYLQQSGGDYDAAGDLAVKNGDGSLAQGLYKQASDRRKGLADALDAQSKATSAQLDLVGKITATMGDSPDHYQAGLTALNGIIKDLNLKQLIEKVAPPDATPDQIPGIVQNLSQMQVTAAERMRQHDEFVKGFLGGEYERNLAGELALTPPEQRQGVLQAALALAPDTQTRSALQTKFTPLLTAAPDVLNQMSMTGEQRVVASNQAAERANMVASLSERTRHDLAMEAKPTGGLAPGAQASDPKDIADAIARGEQPPTLTGLYRDAAPVRAELARQGYPLAKATEDWTATQKYLSTLNGQQQVRLRQAIGFTSSSLDLVEDLAKQWDAGGFPILNAAQLSLAKNGALGPKAQQIATKLTAQVADLTSELGTVYKGGNSSTDESLKLAAQNLSTNWSRDTLLSNIDQIRKNLAIRENSIKLAGAAGVNEGNPYTPPSNVPEKSVTMAELGIIAKNRGTTVEQEKARATAAGYVIR